MHLYSLPLAASRFTSTVSIIATIAASTGTVSLPKAFRAVLPLTVSTCSPIPAKPPKYQAPPIEVPKGTGHTTTDRLITEDVARSLIDGGNTAICQAANAIVTPSAWDLFKQKGIEVIRK